MKKGKDIEIKLPLKRAEEIANYYEFPVIVFFSPEVKLKGKRSKIISKKIEKLEKLKKEIVSLIENI